MIPQGPAKGQTMEYGRAIAMEAKLFLAHLSKLGSIALALLLCLGAHNRVLAEGASAGCPAETPQKTEQNCLKVIEASKNQAEIVKALAVLCTATPSHASIRGETASYCDRALAINPNLATALEARGLFKLGAASLAKDPKEKEHLLAQAKSDLDKLVKVAPKEARSWTAQANFAMKQSNWNAALSAANKAAALSPEDASVYALRGHIRSAVHNQDEALADYLQCVRLAPGDTRTLTDIAQIYFQKQNFAEALNYVSKAVAGGDKSGAAGAALTLRGTIHLQMGETAQAKNDFKQALAIRSTDKEALQGLEKATGSHLPSPYDCQMAVLKPEEAVKICSAVLEYVTDYAVVEARARAYLNLKQYYLAVSDYTALIAHEPESGEYYLHRALAFKTSGKFVLALEDVDTGIAKHKNLHKPVTSALEFEIRADILTKLGRDQDAIAEYTHVLSIEPKNANAMLRRAEIHNHLGRTEAAMTDVDAALVLNADGSDAHALKGALLAKLGQRESAIAELRRAVAAARRYCTSESKWCIDPKAELQRLGVAS